MKQDRVSRRMLGIGLLALTLGVSPAMSQEPKMPKAPEPTVPEIFTLMGEFVRVAYNNDGFVTLGYRMAQQATGEEWMLLDVGVTVRTKGEVKLKREHFSIKTPDGTVIPLATQKEYNEAGQLMALNARAKVVRDSINYFPPSVNRGCALMFFASSTGDGPRIAYDEVELSSSRGCVGRLYFKVPGGISVGQHWLNVDFGAGQVQVPFRILTKEEEKEFRKNWQDIKKVHDEALG